MAVTSPETLSLHSAEMTLDEWGALDEEESGELVDGRLVEEEAPTFLHEAAVAWLFFKLYGWGEKIRAQVYSSEAKYAVAAHRGRKPDLSVYFSGEATPNPRHSMGRVPPTIAVEVISESDRDVRRDRVEKLVDYANFGIRFYWLVDPFRRTFEIFERGSDGRYALALTAADGEHPIPGCDGLTLDLDELWRKLDALSRIE